MGIRASILASKPGQSRTGPTVETFEMDKTWHGLHFLLSGSAESVTGPEGFLLNGEQIEEAGDAEVYLHTPVEVKAFNRVLIDATPQVLLERYDSAKMKALDIYPDVEWNQQDFDYLLEYYNGLRPFVQRHADADHELLVLIC